jgi:hypothetical protein
MMKANADFRAAMEAAVKKNDPETAKIIAKIVPPTNWDRMRERFRLPKPEEPAFVEAAIERLGIELFHMAKPEQRPVARKLHERVMKHADIVARVGALRAAAVEGRMEAFRQLGEAYKKQVDLEVAELKRKYPPAGAPAEPAAVGTPTKGQ